MGECHVSDMLTSTFGSVSVDINSAPYQASLRLTAVALKKGNAEKRSEGGLDPTGSNYGRRVSRRAMCRTP